MAVLTPTQLADLVSIPGGLRADSATLYLPTGYGGPVNAPLIANITARSCWNWALCAGLETNAQRDSTPERLYAHTGMVNTNTGGAYTQLQVTYGTEPQLETLWADAAAEVPDDPTGDPPRLLFMQAMARVAARSSGLEPSAGATPYRLHVTTTRAQWYGWMHWGLSFTHGGNTRFVQTDTGNPLYWGGHRLWEAHQAGFIETSIYLRELHDGHVSVLGLFLEMLRCARCHRAKPATTAGRRWYRCAVTANHVFCHECIRDMPWQLEQGQRRYTCTQGGCANAATAQVADP